MLDQLRLLLQLQGIDARVHELEVAIEALPKPLESDKETLDKLEQMLAAEQARFTETESWRKEQEQTLALEDEGIKKAKIKLQASKTPKDHAAATRELDNKRKARSEREDEMLKVMEALEKARAEIETHEQTVTALRERVEAESARIQGQVDELRAEVDTSSAGRDELVSQIDSELMQRYQRIRRKRGIAMAPVRDGVCQGCHMSVPPQLDIMLARGDSIETCPRCYRLLYHHSMLDKLTGDAAES
ncbi:zinc ribbon domain-containing protein [Haliangium sp.]|uniref:zinc ribbon domain-containing protein n=1 Tax=Haliangium sp. TaxID=2663208 RepID=UPI003D12B692